MTSSIQNTLTEPDTAEAEAVAAEPQESTLERRVLDGDVTVNRRRVGHRRRFTVGTV